MLRRTDNGDEAKMRAGSKSLGQDLQRRFDAQTHVKMGWVVYEEDFFNLTSSLGSHTQAEEEEEEEERGGGEEGVMLEHFWFPTNPFHL